MERRQRSPSPMYSGEIERKETDAWVRHYAELVDTSLNIYKDEKCRESLILDHGTIFLNKGERDHHFKFDIDTKTKKSDKIKKFHFRTQKHTDREMWRGFVVGISTGEAPSDLDLGDSQILGIEDEIKKLKTTWRTSDYISKSNTPSTTSSSSGSQGVRSHGSSSTSGHISFDDSVSVTGGGPTVIHKFYRTNNPREGQISPSWFFPGCSRELSEKILVNAGSYGNTLMRESTHHMNCGSYVISKYFQQKGEFRFEHFEIIRTRQGYQINVQNVMEMSVCLTEVMALFQIMAGPDTRPLKTNTLEDFGLEIPVYVTQLTEHRVGPPKDPAVDYLKTNVEDYKHEDKKLRNINKGHTFTPGKVKKFNKSLPQHTSGFDLHAFHQLPDEHIALNCLGSSHHTLHVTGLQERTYDAVDKLDQVLDSYDDSETQSNEYVNENFKGQQPGYGNNDSRPLPEIPPPPPPPPPAPCSSITSTDDYESIPDKIAPPPPFSFIPDKVRMTRRKTEPAIFENQQMIVEALKKLNNLKTGIPSMDFQKQVPVHTKAPPSTICPPYLQSSSSSPGLRHKSSSCLEFPNNTVSNNSAMFTERNNNTPGHDFTTKLFTPQNSSHDTDEASGGCSIDTTSPGNVKDLSRKLFPNNISTEATSKDQFNNNKRKVEEALKSVRQDTEYSVIPADEVVSNLYMNT